MQHLVVTLHGMVCEACNTGWMHDLEEKVKPFLKPLLINKHGADLDLTQQRHLARWAVMKVLLMEHVMRQKHPQIRTTAGYVPSEPELAWLMAEACPPPRSAGRLLDRLRSAARRGASSQATTAVTFRFQGGRSSPLAEPPGSTVSRQPRHTCNIKHTDTPERAQARSAETKIPTNPHSRTRT